jgi:hypothetical protein
MSTMNLIEFLRARLDEDAEVARGASPGPWSPDAEHYEVVAVDGETVADGFALSNRQLRATVDHIARHDPVRVLAEVDAKRRILDEVVDEATGLDMSVDGDRRVGPRDTTTEPYLGTVLLRLLALPYAEHPDYREEWRPQVGDTLPD